MKRALQALLIAPGDAVRRAIERGEKTITVREGHRDHSPGPVMLCCQIEPWCVMADITEVRHCTLEEVSEDDLRADGFRDHHDMLVQLKRFYANLRMGSPVTVIRWKDARGKLVDAARSG